MAKLVVVKGDPVQGTDKHNVSGTGPNPAPPPAPTPVNYAGIGSYQYVGSMTDSLSSFVKIGGKPAALVSSNSSLNPGQSAPPAGLHSGPAGSDFAPGAGSPAPVPTTATLSITDAIGTGVPNSAAGSALLTIGGTKALLDGDKIDTCDGLGAKANSAVTAAGQSFVRCSA
jgi:uncharacterized Zn-binding protein involved in type VI secretion